MYMPQHTAHGLKSAEMHWIGWVGGSRDGCGVVPGSALVEARGHVLLQLAQLLEVFSLVALEALLGQGHVLVVALHHGLGGELNWGSRLEVGVEENKTPPK